MSNAKKIILIIPLIILLIFAGFVNFNSEEVRASHTTTFTFDTTAESWTFTSDNTACSGALTTATGNPAGSLETTGSKTGGGLTCNTYWEWSGTWQNLGVPEGNTVTGVSGSYEYAVSDSTGGTWDTGALELRNSGGTLRETLVAALTGQSGTIGFTGRSGIEQTFTGESHDTAIILRLNTSIAFPGGGHSWTGQNDNIAVTITHEAPATEPAQPNPPTFSNVSTSTVTVNWSAVDNANFYRIERATSTNGEPAGGTFSEIATTTEIFHNDSGLTPNTSYWYRIIAENEIGQSGPSEPRGQLLFPLPPPEAPTFGDVAHNSIEIFWLIPEGGSAFYSIERATSSPSGFMEVATTTATSTIDTALQPETEYFYQIISINATGSSTPSEYNSTTTLAEPLDPPGTPGNPSYMNVSTSTLTVSWGHPGTGGTPDFYRIERATGTNGEPDGSAFIQIDTVNYPSTSYDDTNLLSNTTYWYRIQAENTAGVGPYSNATSVTTEDYVPPPDPATWRESENIQAGTAKNENIRLRIQVDNQGKLVNSDSANFRLEYSTENLNDWSVITFNSNDPSCETATTTVAFRLCRSSFFNNQDLTSPRLSPPSGKSTSTDFKAGYIMDESSTAPTITVTTEEYTELEWSLQATDGAVDGQVYEFRVTDDGDLIGTYENLAKLMVESDEPIITQNYFRWYVNAETENELNPSDPWPPGVENLGENAPITKENLPPAPGSVLRLRTTLSIGGLTMPELSKRFRLEFGEKETSCSAITSWTEISDLAVWSGYNNSGLTAGTEITALLITSVSDVAGTYEEGNPSALNPNRVNVGQDAEYDWAIRHNGAKPDTAYCFRIVHDSGNELDGVNFYPELMTAGYNSETGNWRWYDDSENITPANPLAGENVSPSNIGFNNTVKLRITVKETEGVTGENIKFRLEFSEHSDFSSAEFVAPMSDCTDLSLWCYDVGGGEDNQIIPSSLLSDADVCVGGLGDGCGTHNEHPTSTSAFSHPAGAATEFEFTVRHAGARANTTYFFRLVDTATDEFLPKGEGKAFPSLSSEGSQLEFSINGLPAGTSTEGITTDVEMSPTGALFGALSVGEDLKAAQRFNITTNATQGYSLFVFERLGFSRNGGEEKIEPILSTNSNPGGWSAVCLEEAKSCWGYHTSDDVLSSGVQGRFSPSDSYAAFTDLPKEVGWKSGPTEEDIIDMVYRVRVAGTQESGDYESRVAYIIVPKF